MSFNPDSTETEEKPLTFSKDKDYSGSNADKSAGGFHNSCTKGAHQPRYLRLFCVKTSGSTALVDWMGTPSGVPVPLVRFVNPIRSATLFHNEVAENKPH